MSTAGFNALWLLCVLLLMIAFALAIRRRRLAAKEATTNTPANATTFIRPNGTEVRIHMTRPMNPSTDPMLYNTNNNVIQPPPPAFDPEEAPPPSYQDFRKDVLIHPSSTNANNNNTTS